MFVSSASVVVVAPAKSVSPFPALASSSVLSAVASATSPTKKNTKKKKIDLHIEYS